MIKLFRCLFIETDFPYFNPVAFILTSFPTERGESYLIFPLSFFFILGNYQNVWAFFCDPPLFHHVARKCQKEMVQTFICICFASRMSSASYSVHSPSCLHLFLPTWSAPPSLPLSSPNLRPALFPSFIFYFLKRTGLICVLTNIHSPLQLFSAPPRPFTPSHAVLTSPHSPPFSASFQFLLLKWDVVCTEESVYIPYRRPLSGY